MFQFSSIEQYHAQLREETISCAAVTEHYLERISRTSHLNAFIHVFADEARQKALELDQHRQQGRPIGRLHGVVIGIKDVICYKDHPVTAASKILEGYFPIYSSTVVERLLAEEAIIIGSLNCDEFAMGSTNENSTYGRVLNPMDESRVPGGSSGGSAAAVSAGLCMVSLGSDTGGSVRQPAGFCGIYGFKPSYGAVSRYGLIAYASSFDQIGVFASSVQDIAAVFEVVSGPDEYDSTVSHHPWKVRDNLSAGSHTNKFRFAWFPEALEHPSLDPEIRSSIKKYLEQLVADGHTVSPVSFEYLEYVVPTYYILTTAEASSNLARYDGLRYGGSSLQKTSLTEFYKRNRTARFGTEVKRRIMLGTFVLSAGYFDAYFNRAQQVRRLLHEKTNLIFNDFDAIVLPIAPSTAPRFGEETDDPVAIYLADIFTVFANLVGIPGISLPVFKHSNNLPFGIQLLSSRLEDLSLLRISNQLMQQYK